MIWIAYYDQDWHEGITSIEEIIEIDVQTIPNYKNGVKSFLEITSNSIKIGGICDELIYGSSLVSKIGTAFTIGTPAEPTQLSAVLEEEMDRAAIQKHRSFETTSF
jgi:hypothetical protein